MLCEQKKKNLFYNYLFTEILNGFRSNYIHEYTIDEHI